jgi:hypothetical protein
LASASCARLTAVFLMKPSALPARPAQVADAPSVTHDPAASNANPIARERVLTPLKEMFRKHNADACQP